jgi:L-fuconolactonase
MLPDFPITDTHVHLWDPAKLRYGWLRDHLSRPHGLPEFEAARGGIAVGSIVFVEAGAHADDALAEAEWVSALAAKEPRLQGIVANASLEQGDGVTAHLEALAHLQLVRGVRRLLQGESDARYCLRPSLFVRHLHQAPAAARRRGTCPRLPGGDIRSGPYRQAGY